MYVIKRCEKGHEVHLHDNGLVVHMNKNGCVKYSLDRAISAEGPSDISTARIFS